MQFNVLSIVSEVILFFTCSIFGVVFMVLTKRAVYVKLAHRLSSFHFIVKITFGLCCRDLDGVSQIAMDHWS